ncbi:MAG: hypothetical protein JW817_07480 [Clostridiales bacterium]|nr:hypothetical protein [Clostridiales bacterium]
MSKGSGVGRTERCAALLVIITVCAFLLFSCAKKTPDPSDYRSYLGDYAYDASLTAMVYEDFEGEGFGILYRSVTDFGGYVTNAPLPVLVYFYTSLHDDYAGTTAEVEQIAEDYNTQLLVITVNVFREKTITEHYQVQTVPEFVILKDGKVDQRFDGTTRGSWSQEELRQWVVEGIG